MTYRVDLSCWDSGASFLAELLLQAGMKIRNLIDLVPDIHANAICENIIIGTQQDT